MVCSQMYLKMIVCFSIYYKRCMSKSKCNGKLLDITNFLSQRVHVTPKIGIISGSGMGSVATGIENQLVIPYTLIPGFPKSTVQGHTGQLIFGYIGGVPVMCMQGRFHFFEGYSTYECAMPVRLMKNLGVTHLIIFNAAGGVNKKYKVGDIMLIKDHMNLLGLAGFNPLIGPNEDDYGPRFPIMNKAYNKHLIKIAKLFAKQENFIDVIQEGVYACVAGPNFETVAEVKMLRLMGVDAVGMSTIPEVIIAKHCNMSVFAFSVITNICVDSYEEVEAHDHEKTISVANGREYLLKKLIFRVVQCIGTHK